MAAVELQANGLPKIIEADGDEGNVVDLSTVEIVPLGPPQAAPRRAQISDSVLTKSPSPPTAAQMKRDIRARLSVVRKEIALRKKLEREEQQLVRLLKAASEKPPTVRPIRATA